MPLPTTFADRTTLRVGGPARAWIVAQTEQQVVDAVRACDASTEPLLILGGGSNLLVADEGFPGTVLCLAVRGVSAGTRTADGATVTLVVMAGEPWDDVVALTVDQGWSGLEALSGIPGLAGATPIQNVGAYGQDVAQVIESVRALDRRTGRIQVLDHDSCRFDYRTSVFKQDPGRWIVLSITVRLSAKRTGVVRYSELARSLGLEVGDVADVGEIRAGVLSLRTHKGMVLDALDHDTWSAGSFFTNPIVDAQIAAGIPAACPRYPTSLGVKLSAAWLIEQSGITRGHRTRAGSGARVSAKHTLALTNTGGATAADVLELAREIQAGVHEHFGITLQPEVSLVGCSL